MSYRYPVPVGTMTRDYDDTGRQICVGTFVKKRFREKVIEARDGEGGDPSLGFVRARVLPFPENLPRFGLSCELSFQPADMRRAQPKSLPQSSEGIVVAVLTLRHTEPKILEGGRIRRKLGRCGSYLIGRVHFDYLRAALQAIPEDGLVRVLIRQVGKRWLMSLSSAPADVAEHASEAANA